MLEPSCLVHGTTIAVDGRAALIIGPSGAGKSDLALRCIMTLFHDAGRPLTASLVADDQTLVTRRGQRLEVRAPDTIAGRIEVRGLGIVAMPASELAELRLVADVSPGQQVPRLPDPLEWHELLGLRVPLVRLRSWEAGAPARLVLALLRLGGS
ncbi:MAG: HPr kinase/phosphatase C-terminal domain-containing protein [Hyphomicrobiaceae bacterium]|nr:HPr kinase/phosphatase C-terminal domain-containing protein [Hyphomicrobiaceae bacterium]